MIDVPHPEELKDFDLNEFEVPKEIERRGYMYILKDSAFPGYVKVGRSTSVQKRLYAYNADKPFKTARMIQVSSLFSNAYDTEKKVLDYLYSVTEPTTLSKEWFLDKYENTIRNVIEKLEEQEKLNLIENE